MGTYATAEDLLIHSEFPRVQAMGRAMLEVYIGRAEVAVAEWLPWRSDLTPAEQAEFVAQMRLAVCLIAERILLAAPGAAAAAAGITSETMGRYSYSRSAGVRAGKPVEGVIIPAEAETILARWSLRDEDADIGRVERTTVFAEALLADVGGGERLLVDEDYFFVGEPEDRRARG